MGIRWTRTAELPVDGADELFAEARAAAFAAGLEQVAFVQEFRAEHLPGGLLEPEEVADWIEERTGEPTQDTSPKVDYFPPDSSINVPRSAHEDSPAGKLAAVVNLLHRFVGGFKAPLTELVLTGELRPKGSITHRIEPRPEFRAASTIHLEIDPTTTATDVAELYTQLRSDMFGGGRPPRRPNERLLRLVMFDREQPDDAPASARAEAWDAWCEQAGRPEWAYGDVGRHYTRDVNVALRRLTNGTDDGEQPFHELRRGEYLS